jgi:hypothetical protein
LKRKITLEFDCFKSIDSLPLQERPKKIEELDEKRKKLYEQGYKKGKDSLVLYRSLPLESIKDKIIEDKSKIPYEGIPWNLVCGKFKVRSYDDCRNMWF